MIENPIFDLMLKAKSLNVGKIHRPLYFMAPLNNTEANSVDWLKFRKRILPLDALKFEGSHLDYLITPKSYSFGLRDVNIFIGEPDRDVSSITDLTEVEGEKLLIVNQVMVNKLLDFGNKNVQITLGFNSEDVSLLGNHTLKRLHSHIYLVEDSVLNKNLTSISWSELNWFDRLSLIEPFSKIFHDFIISLKEKKNLFPNQGFSRLEENFGFTSIYFSDTKNFKSLFPGLVNLYTNMRCEYNKIQEVFTDKSLDFTTQRYIPRARKDRVKRLSTYLNKQNFISRDSVVLLKYLANNLVAAAPGREKGIITKANQIWISKGFSGAFNFSFSKESPEFRLDIIPRVITTACSSKTLCNKDVPIVFGRDKTPATEKELSEIKDYWQTIQKIVDKELPGNIIDLQNI